MTPPSPSSSPSASSASSPSVTQPPWPQGIRVCRFLPQELALPEGIDQVLGVQLRLRVPFRGITTRELLLLHGPYGWGEFCPFPEYTLPATVQWLSSALEAALKPPLEPRRSHIEVNGTVPAIPASQAAQLVHQYQATTIKVKVAQVGQGMDDDIERIRAVRAALGDEGHIRIDANAAWEIDEAVTRIRAYSQAARPDGADSTHPGLEYVEQPCKSLEELAKVRTLVGVPIAADESLRLSLDPFDLPGLDEACDVLIVKAAPLGGVRRALAVVAHHNKPAVVSSALESCIGMDAGFQLAGSIPNLAGACGLGTGRLFIQDLCANPRVHAFTHTPIKRDSINLDRLPVDVTLSAVDPIAHQLREAIPHLSWIFGGDEEEQKL